MALPLALLPCCVATQPTVASTQPPQPYPWLHGGTLTGDLPLGTASSADPLINWRWDTAALSKNSTNSTLNASAPQVYTLLPARVTATRMPTSFAGLDQLTQPRSGTAAGLLPQQPPLDAPPVTVTGPGTLRVDFGVESAGWLELCSPDTSSAVLERLTMAISETTHPYVFQPLMHDGKVSLAHKQLKPVSVGGCWYRLVTNPELYEGVRHGFIDVAPPPPGGAPLAPWHIAAVRVVAQTLPIDYHGSLTAAAGSEVLSEIWYSAAMCCKLNMLKGSRSTNIMPVLVIFQVYFDILLVISDNLGTELMDRGDRNAFAGDAYPTISAIMAAFGQWDYVGTSIDRTGEFTTNLASLTTC